MDTPPMVLDSPHPEAVASGIDVAGLIRRVRRNADLSQADLARLVGVHQSTVARWENRLAQPGVGAFQRLLEVAGLRLAVLDVEEQAVQPMREDTPRDRAGRRWPAHLDLRDAMEPFTGQPLVRAHARPLRDLRRGWAASTAADHPSVGELTALREARRAAQRARMAPFIARAKAVRLAAEGPPTGCDCAAACHGVRGCIPACECGCEPRVPEAGAS